MTDKLTVNGVVPVEITLGGTPLSEITMDGDTIWSAAVPDLYLFEDGDSSSFNNWSLDSWWQSPSGVGQYYFDYDSGQLRVGAALIFQSGEVEVVIKSITFNASIYSTVKLDWVGYKTDSSGSAITLCDPYVTSAPFLYTEGFFRTTDSINISHITGTRTLTIPIYLNTSSSILLEYYVRIHNVWLEA